MANKPNCYDCKHRGDLAGSAHSNCNHPDTASSRDNPLAGLVALLGKRVGGPVIDAGSAVKLGIKASPHGVLKGWFQWPFNFDPVWLQACNGFEPKEVQPK